MIEVAVKTQWQGKVAVRAQYIYEAVKNQEGLMIIHGTGVMTIPAGELKDRIAGMSDEVYRDTFRQHPKDKLYYFVWRPDAVQTKLGV